MTPARRDLPSLSRLAAAIGIGATLVCIVAAFVDLDRLLQGWLVTWLFLIGIALAAMMNVMIHELSGGHWGLVLRPPLEAAMLTLPLLAVLAAPLLLGMPHLFEWAHPDAVVHRDVIAAKRWFLNVTGFVVRNIAWLAIWSALALWFARALARPDAPMRRRIAVLGLLVYFVTVTLFAYDWIASLLPQWNSTAIGVRLGSTQFLGALAFGVAWVSAKATAGRSAAATTPRDFHDFGNLLLTYCMFWAYIAYTQFFIVWAEDLPHEIAWFATRIDTSWRHVAFVVLACEFALPFLAMLFRAVKRAPVLLGFVCAIVLIGNWLDVFWLTVPSLRRDGFALTWYDIAALIAQGGLWLAAVAACLPRLASRSALTPTPEARTHG